MKKIIISTLLTLLFWACKEKTKLSYSVTATSPTEYPTEVHLGFFTDAKNQLICGVPKTGMLQAGWQGDGAKGGQGGSVIPAHIDLTYVAYAEKKFYHLDADLPKEKILEVFRKGYLTQSNEIDENGKKMMVPAHYDILTVGMAPGGMVVIWLSGNKSRVEICRLQAKETFVDVNDFYQNADNENQEQFFNSWFKLAVPDSIQAEIEKNGIPFKLWDDYRIRYKYRFVVNPYDDKDKVTGVHNLQYSGEEDFITKQSDAEKYREQGIPYNVTVEFTKYFVNIIFDDRETISVFEALQEKHPGKPIDIVLTPTFMYEDIKVSVKCEQEEIKLQKYKLDGVYGG
ncbi:DUF2931 family protein [Kaistella carnis]|uniref:DUF2931 family protein n=1 Tax=Kaistella carnis TaxID=1241979 RepID=A0A3G8XHX0_9FLAO|nr:DUF2931 family protein [Kaistella carnis]AZI32659.1 DUF2931 family protein [Kaistella carnis]